MLLKYTTAVWFICISRPRRFGKFVGINYDKENENKPHSCVIKRIVADVTAKTRSRHASYNDSSFLNRLIS